MTSYCDVTNNVYPVTMTNIHHCSILEFGRTASNQAVASGITRPLQTTAPRIYFVVFRAHPVRGGSHIQRNATGEFATIHFKYSVLAEVDKKRSLDLRRRILHVFSDAESKRFLCRWTGGGAEMSGLWNFPVRVQSWSDKIESDPVLIHKIFENHQSDPVLIRPCKIMCFYFSSWGKTTTETILPSTWLVEGKIVRALLLHQETK